MVQLRPDQFRILNRARLDAVTLQRVLPQLQHVVARARTRHDGFRRGGSLQPLQRAAEGLIAFLSDQFLVAAKQVVLREMPRPHRRNRRGQIVYEVHGECAFQGPIQVYVRTAAREQPVAWKTLLQTLLHEWVHHYDFAAFGDSVHCSGFYARMNQLYHPLREGQP